MGHARIKTHKRRSRTWYRTARARRQQRRKFKGEAVWMILQRPKQERRRAELSLLLSKEGAKGGRLRLRRCQRGLMLAAPDDTLPQILYLTLFVF